MCGFVGFINNQPQEDLLEKMLEIQSHRGRDDRGIYIDNETGVHLGHNRLAIIDLSPQGKQPFVSPCKNYVLVFNGEIYNYRDLRKELIEKGYKFRSNTDTEVVLYSYIEWGIEAVDRFIGMFAIGILDKKRRKIILIRDRAGIKPLYFYNRGKSFIFSSELKSIYVHPEFKKDLNLDILPYYFQFGYIPSPFTIYRNAYKLDQGSYLEYDLDSGVYIIEKYWEIDDKYKLEKFKPNENEILEQLESLLEDAVNLRMIADVPVGVFLSGGIDSSLVTALLSKNRKIKTFTIGFKEKDFDESKHAKKIANYLGTDHTEHILEEKNLTSLIDNLPFIYDEPFGDSSAIPTLIISSIARKDVKVVLSADGGDELFLGYSKYFFLDKINKLKSNKFLFYILKLALNLLNENMVYTVNNLLPEKFRQRNIKDRFLKFKRAVNSKSREEMFINASSYMDRNQLQNLVNLRIRKGIYSKFFSDVEDFLDYMMLTDYKTFLTDDVLVKVDRATMFSSLEGREPLLDHRLVEFSARIPSSLKYKNNQGKYLTRRILYKYLPRDLIDRPKSGFQIPLNKWLRTVWKDKINYYLDKNKLDKDIFNVDYVEYLKNELFKGKTVESVVWFILMFQMWKEKWL